MQIEFPTILTHPDDGADEIVVATQFPATSIFGHVVGGTGQKAQRWTQAAADVAAAVSALERWCICLQHLTHVRVVGDGKAEEIGLLHVVGETVPHILIVVEVHGVVKACLLYTSLLPCDPSCQSSIVRQLF